MRQVLAIALLAACGGSEQRKTAPPPEPPARASDAGAPAPDAAPGLTEAQARAILFDAFREAGFRVLQDVRLTRGDVDVTLDGLDPQRRVGYEYIAGPERGLDLGSEERAALEGLEVKVLVVDEAGQERVRSEAARFLKDLPRSADE